MSWKPIIRDVVIIYALTFLGGFVIGFIGAANQTTIALVNIILGTAGFAISGCLAGENRFRHLIKVAFGLWLVNLTNILLLGDTLTHWLLSALFILVIMGAGGAISFIFVRSPSNKIAR